MTDIEVARYALRTFTLDPRARQLVSVSAYIPGRGDWADGTCTAVCLADHPIFFAGGGLVSGTFPLTWYKNYMDVRHTAPYLDCHCGVYGSLSLNHLIDQYRFETMKIITVIAAEGETIIGSRGLRTQYARVVAYWSPFRKFRRAADAQFEGAQHFKSLEEMLSEYQLPRYLPDPENTPGGRHWA